MGIELCDRLGREAVLQAGRLNGEEHMAEATGTLERSLVQRIVLTPETVNSKIELVGGSGWHSQHRSQAETQTAPDADPRPNAKQPPGEGGCVAQLDFAS